MKWMSLLVSLPAPVAALLSSLVLAQTGVPPLPDTSKYYLNIFSLVLNLFLEPPPIDVVLSALPLQPLLLLS